MSRPGKCIDNGPMEAFFGTLKSEMYNGKKFKNYDELKKAIDSYIFFYNNQRFQAKLKSMAPNKYRSHALI
ncbi:IS3 family transposase [Mycoplasmatota bacterium WC44]